MRSHMGNKNQYINISRIFIFSSLIFFLFSVFSVYQYKIYDLKSLVLFYVYELIFWIGIKIGSGSLNKLRIGNNNASGNAKQVAFSINRQGCFIIHIIFAAAFISFFYFLYLYGSSYSITSFGASIKAEFDVVARTKLEVITQFVLFAGSATYLIVIGAKNTVSKFTLGLARVCLFLPGLRGAFLGRRFTLAIETLIFFFAEFSSLNISYRSLGANEKRIIKRVLAVLVLVAVVMLYIFSRRIVYLPEAMRVAYPGDMWLKPFWNRVYARIGNGMSVLAYVSFYTSHAPYAFSYSYSEVYPTFPEYWGLSTCRVLIQIITTLFGIHPNYAEMANQVPGIARYTGFAGAVIQDFGKVFAPVVSFVFGFIFSRIENRRYNSSICHALYPLIQVACLFAPVYFFSVGNIDQVGFWTIILAPLCLSRRRFLTNNNYF